MEPSEIASQPKYPILPRHGACLICRNKKQRCDAHKPECYECLSANRKCRYEDEAYRTRTQILQDRVKELEAQIREIEEKQGKSAPESVSSPPNTSSDLQKYSSGHSPLLSGSSSHSRFWSGDSGSPTISSYSDFSNRKVFPPAPNSLGIGSNALELNPSWPSPDVTGRLLDIFFLHRAQCWFELHTGRVMQSLEPAATEPMIPALFSAMLLLACHFAQDPSLQAWESTFLERTKNEIEVNIVRAHGGGKDKYNPLHHLQAMVMLGVYYYFKGRLLEGHVHTSHATRFAVALGVHQINSRIFRQDLTTHQAKRTCGIERWCPRDSIELGEAINVWWSCFNWDLGGSTLVGLPLSVSNEEITTVWPRLLSDFESGEALPDDNYSVASLLDLELSHIVADVSRDNAKSLLSKVYILLRCASNLDMERISDPEGTDEWWTLFERCDQSLNRFMQTMPPAHLARNVEALASLVQIHTAIYCCDVQLHCALAEYEWFLGSQGDPRCIQPDGTLGGISYARCVEACRAASLVATLVTDMDMSYMHMFTGIGWVCVSEMVARDVPRLRQSGRAAQAEEKEKEWEVVEMCMGKLVATYPVLMLQVEQMRAMKRDQLTRLCGAV